MSITKTGKNKLLLLILLVILIALTASIVDASVGSQAKDAFARTKFYVTKAPFWVNSLIILGVAYILYSIFLSKNVGGGNAQLVIIIIILAAGSMILSTKISDFDGNPNYIWKADNFKKTTQFLLGPPEGQKLSACRQQEYSFWSSNNQC